MADIQNQNNHNYELSYAHTDVKYRYETASEAGKAFADADAKLAPRVTQSDGNDARTLAKVGREGDEYYKQVPSLDAVRAANPLERDMLFWSAYHERIAEHTRANNSPAIDGAPAEQKEPEKSDADKGRETEDKKSITTPAIDNVLEGSAEPQKPLPALAQDEKFDLPLNFHERFIREQKENQQNLYRSYDDKRPAISDKGDSLHTKNADRATAMDMVELAAHRGWSSMKVKGPEEFRREMWIEGTAQGMNVQGYRPNDKDRAEADRRAELIGERSIERIDKVGSDRNTHIGRQQTNDIGSAPKESSNIIPMIDYLKGVEGKITDIGKAPFRGREGAASTPYIELELKDGRAHKVWGVGLPDMVADNKLKIGDSATIYDNGQKAVTVKERDPKTGEFREKDTFRREWGARDIERAPDRQDSLIEPNQKMDEASLDKIARPKEPEQSITDTKLNIPKGHSDRLEERINQKDAVRDPALRGAASTLARVDAELRAAGVSEKDRATVRSNASHELAKGIRDGQHIPVQKLPNVTKTQEQAAAVVKASDLRQNVGDKSHERTEDKNRGRER